MFFSICISSLEKCLFKSFVHFKIGLSFYLRCKLFLFLIYSGYKLSDMIYRYFLPFCGMSLHFHDHLLVALKSTA